jgi:hypothetical protein
MTPDHHPGQLEFQDLGIVFSDSAANVPTAAGSLGYSNTLFSLTDGAGTYEPRSVYTQTHSQLADLIHYLDDGPTITGAYKVTTYVGGAFVKTITWYTSSAQTKKIVDRTLTYPSGSYATVITDAWRVFAADGATILHSASDQITYQGIAEVSRARTYA